MSSPELIQTYLSIPSNEDNTITELAASSVIQNSSTLSTSSTFDIFNPLIEFLHIGGPVVWILMVFSVVALTLSILKLTQFYLAKAEKSNDLELSLRAWQHGEIAKAASALNIQAPMSKIVLAAQQACCEIYGRHRTETDSHNKLLETYKDELSRQANALMQSLRSYLRPLDMIAALSPLLGLLGTVLGMIEAFKQMELAGSQVDPSILSGGIWQALLTTAVGLAVAIPVVMLHGYFERKCERIAFLLDDAVTRVFTLMPESLKNNKAEKQHELPHAA